MSAAASFPRIWPWIVRATAVAALVSLVVEFGFPVDADAAVLHALEAASVAVFAIDAVLRLALSRDRRAHLKQHWIEVVLLALLVVQGAGLVILARGTALAGLYLVLLQAYLLLQMAFRAVRANEKLAERVLRPSWILAGGFAALIAAGTGLLLLPNCRAPGARAWTLSDAAFTATSAACVTGLTVRDTGSELSFRGQIVVLGLIQLGGLGIVTVALCLSFLQRRNLQLRQMVAAREIVSADRLGDLGRLLGSTLLVALGAEALGCAALWAGTSGAGVEGAGRLWWSAFHAVSAFCNAGFGLHRDSLIPQGGSLAVCSTIMALIVLGGLGFPVILELIAWAAARGRRRLSLQAKLTLTTSAVLIAAGAVLFLLSESGHALAGRPAGRAALDSLFQSVTARTAGFNTLDLSALRSSSLLLLIVLMAIGGSPASTAGGMKTLAVATLGLTVGSILRNRETVEAYGRAIPRASVNAAVAVAFLYGLAVLTTTGLLSATQPGIPFLDLFFESVSAVGTVGLSTGATLRVDGVGRLVLGAAMFVGRLGPLAVLWTMFSRPGALRYAYPEEPLVVS